MWWLAGSAGAEVTSPEGCYCVGRVGNVNCDYRDEVTLADLMLLIDHLFINYTRLPNRWEANCNGDAAGEITLGDVSALIDYFFITQTDLPYCPKPPNHPPATHLLGTAPAEPLINSPTPRPVTGIPMSWTAEDFEDYPHFQPPLECEYRMYGPYPDDLFDTIVARFLVPVLQTEYGRLLRIGADPPELLICCDTFYVAGQRQIECDTILADTVTADGEYGTLETLFDVDNPAFRDNPDFNRVAHSSAASGSAWTLDTAVTMYDLFSQYERDTTWVANFIFWVRARDAADTMLYDPTPAFRCVEAFDPKFERDLLVVEWTNAAGENAPVSRDSVAAFWQSAIASWAASSGRQGEIEYDPSRDYGRVSSGMSGLKLLQAALGHRVLILVQDAVQGGGWSAGGADRDRVLRAMLTGANAWLAARVPLGPFALGSPGSVVNASPAYEECFGVECFHFSGWAWYALFGGLRVEDFIGAIPLDSMAWPHPAIDSALLHSRYTWKASGTFGWRPDLAALPEVGWLVPTEQAEVLYLYESLYGETHDLVPELSFHGWPVMVRLDRGYARSAHSLFTPYAFGQPAAQQLIDSVLEWLYSAPASDVGRSAAGDGE